MRNLLLPIKHSPVADGGERTAPILSAENVFVHTRNTQISQFVQIFLNKYDLSTKKSGFFLVIWTECRQYVQKKCVRKKVVPKHPAGVSELQIKYFLQITGAYSVSTRSNRSFAASTASLLPKATRTPPDSTSDRAAACALSRAASTLHSALRSAASISSVMPQKYR